MSRVSPFKKNHDSDPTEERRVKNAICYFSRSAHHTAHSPASIIIQRPGFPGQVPQLSPALRHRTSQMGATLLQGHLGDDSRCAPLGKDRPTTSTRARGEGRKINKAPGRIPLQRPKVLAGARHRRCQIHRIPKGDSAVIAEPGGRGGAGRERSVGAVAAGPLARANLAVAPGSRHNSASRAKLGEPRHSPVARAANRPPAREQRRGPAL